MLALVSEGALSASAGIPVWVKLACAAAMALGTSLGRWKIIKTIGAPVSTTQVITLIIKAFIM